MLVNEIQVIEKEDGSTEMVKSDADSVVPGDEVLYTIEYRNVGTDAAEAVVISNPIPANMTYVDESASGVGTVIEFSIDDGATYGDKDTLKVVDSEGNERNAKPTDYTNVRWTVESALAPSATSSVEYRALLK